MCVRHNILIWLGGWAGVPFRPMHYGRVQQRCIVSRVSTRCRARSSINHRDLWIKRLVNYLIEFHVRACRHAQIVIFILVLQVYETVLPVLG